MGFGFNSLNVPINKNTVYPTNAGFRVEGGGFRASVGVLSVGVLFVEELNLSYHDT